MAGPVVACFEKVVFEYVCQCGGGCFKRYFLFGNISK
jgi:hypothetical protein